MEQPLEDTKALREEAKKAGVVFDASLIRRASGLHEEIETINKRIDIDMKSAFVGLGPVLVDLKKAMAGILEEVLLIVDAFRKVGDRSGITLNRQIDAAQAQNDAAVRRAGGVDRLAPSQRTVFNNNQALIARNRLALGQQANETELQRQGQNAIDVWSRARGGTSLFDTTKATGPSPAAQQKHFDAELARISEQILAASDDDLHTLLERQAIAQKRLALESAAARTAILDEVATKAITGKQGEVLLAKQAEAAAAKKTQLDAQQAQALRQLQLKQEQDLVSAVSALLDAQLGLTRSAEERGRLEAQILAAQRSIARKLLQQALADDPSKSQAQKNVELAAFDATTGALGKGQEAKAADAVAAERRSIQQASLDAELQGLQLADQLAQTQAEHRRIALRRLELQEQLQAIELEGVIASQTATDAEKKIAQARLDELKREHGGQVEAVNRSTAGPLGQLQQAIPDTADKINEAMENVSAHGLQSLEDGLVGVITHTRKLGDVFREVATQIIADLARIEIEKGIIGPLANALSGGIGGVTGAIGSLFGGKRAAGGPVFPGKIYEVNENGQEFFAPSVAGSIIPHSSVKAAASMAGSTRTEVHNYTTKVVNYGPTTKEFMGWVSQLARGEARGAAAQGAAGVVRGIPGAIDFHRKMGSFG
jgi:hypothetical protein